MAIAAMDGAGWQDLLQAAALGLVFSFLVAKLISIVLSFRDEGLRVARPSSPAPPMPASAPSSADDAPPPAADLMPPVPLAGDDSEDSDWEGVESTELDEEFSAASAYVAANSAAVKVPDEKLLLLYGLYKIATEGPCTTTQPSALKMKARAKWNAWHKLGAMPQEEAMEQYIQIVNELFPTWTSGSTRKTKDEDESASTSATKGTMGPVFSSFAYEGGSDNELDDGIHISAREGATADVLKYLGNGVSVNLKDGEGRTPLHWAVDRGHLSVVEALLNANADVDAKDNEGQTPLHYAAVCDREDIAELLVKHHAGCGIKDGDGNTPTDLCTSAWPFMAPAS